MYDQILAGRAMRKGEKKAGEVARGGCERNQGGVRKSSGLLIQVHCPRHKYSQEGKTE